MPFFLFILVFFFASPASAAPINVMSHGAVCDGETDDTAAINAAVAQALFERSGLYVPASVGCVYSDTITLTKMIPVYGDGPTASALVYCGSGDALRIEPPANRSDNKGQVIRDISIRPCVEGQGQNGIEVVLDPNAYYAYFRYSRVHIGAFGDYGLRFNNDVANGDGFFNGSVMESFILNGIKGTKVGDSLTFSDVTVHGENNVSMTSVPGARLIVFERGQITTKNGFLDLKDISGFRANNVWMEHPSYLGPPDVLVPAGILITNASDTVISGGIIHLHTTGPTRHAHAIALVNAKDTRVFNNSFINKGSESHIYGTVQTAGTAISGNIFNGQTPGIVLQGS